MPGLTALENVALPLELDGQPLRKLRELAMEALGNEKIESLANRFPVNLSRGEQQRVAIARAFMGSRNLLLADEPTGSFDTKTGEVVMQLLRNCRRCRKHGTVERVRDFILTSKGQQDCKLKFS